MSVSEGLPSGKASELNEVATKKKERNRGAFHPVFFKLLNDDGCLKIQQKTAEFL